VAGRSGRTATEARVRSPSEASAFAEVEMQAGELAVVSFDGRPVHLVGPWTTRVFWKVATKVDVERIDVAADPKVAPRHLAMVSRERNAYLLEPVIENHEAGLLYVEGRFVERLAPGRHSYWTVDRKVEVKRLDLRPLTALRRIVDPERAAASIADVDGWLYRLVQFAIREAMASRTLDEVLSAKGRARRGAARLRARARRRERAGGDGARREGRDPAG